MQFFSPQACTPTIVLHDTKISANSSDLFFADLAIAKCMIQDYSSHESFDIEVVFFEVCGVFNKENLL